MAEGGEPAVIRHSDDPEPKWNDFNDLNNQRCQELYICWRKDIGCDLYFVTKEHFRINIHKSVLLMNSAYFRSQALQPTWSRVHHYELPLHRWECLYPLVRFMYGDILYLRSDTVDEIEEIALLLDIIGVVELCHSFRELSVTRRD